MSNFAQTWPPRRGYAACHPKLDVSKPARRFRDRSILQNQRKCDYGDSSAVSGTSNPQKASLEDFEREVAARFGLVPNFFRSAPDAPHVVRELWAFAKSAYLDTPIPTLFKERLFVYLSRFCEVRYCITRHCGFLLGLGRAAGDPNAQAMTIDQVIRLLQRPVPNEERTGAALARLEALARADRLAAPETSYDDDLLTSATVLFLQPARAVRAKHALRVALGGEKFELLVGLLTFSVRLTTGR